LQQNVVVAIKIVAIEWIFCSGRRFHYVRRRTTGESSLWVEGDVIGEMPTMAARAGCQDVVIGNHPFSYSTGMTDAGVRVLGPTAVGEAARDEHGGSAIADREGVVAER
jgi:hypothetical protein